MHLFWLCNHITLISGLAILFRNSFILIAEISLAFMGSFIWMIDYLSRAIFKTHIFGSTEYIFNEIGTTFFFISSLNHLLFLPLVLTALFLINKQKKFAWIGAFAHSFILIFIAVRFQENYNFNCIMESCIAWIPTFNFYPLAYIFIYLTIVILPVNYFLNYLIKKSQ